MKSRNRIETYQKAYWKIFIKITFRKLLAVGRHKFVPNRIYYFRDFVLFNYSINSALDSANGSDDLVIQDARTKVSELLSQRYGLKIYLEEERTCTRNPNPPISWIRLENISISGYTPYGRRPHRPRDADYVSPFFH